MGGSGERAAGCQLAGALEEEEGVRSSAGVGIAPAAAASLAARGVLFENTRQVSETAP